MKNNCVHAYTGKGGSDTMILLIRHTERRGTGGEALYNNFHRFLVFLCHIGADCGSTDNATITGEEELG
eukprot:9272102-Ditylum_brightwellii.AAC.1